MRYNYGAVRESDGRIGTVLDAKKDGRQTVLVVQWNAGPREEVSARAIRVVPLWRSDALRWDLRDEWPGVPHYGPDC